MKKNKSPECQEIPLELIIYAPDCVYESNTETFNQIALGGHCPKEINHEILVSLQKSGKPEGPASNLQPIILTVFTINRVGSRLDHKTPVNQVTYRKERSTTKHVFAVKMVIERTTNARNDRFHLVLLDMNKAFDSIKRKYLIQHLQHNITASVNHSTLIPVHHKETVEVLTTSLII